MPSPLGIVHGSVRKASGRKGSAAFLKKRSKKLLPFRLQQQPCQPQEAQRCTSLWKKSFLLLFFKKEALALLPLAFFGKPTQSKRTPNHDRCPLSLELTQLRKTYGAVRAVADVDLSVAKGEFLTLLGPSGSGKTTLLNIIAGFVIPDAGQVINEGRDITALPPERRDFGMVFQGYALFPHMTVAENVAFALRVRGTPKPEIAVRVQEALDLVQLAGFAERRPAMLSGGQQQRVALARALVFRPALLLLDEPLSALDKKLRAELQEELKLLHRRVGLTFIAVTHDQDEALSMSDRVAILRDGRLVQEGAPETLYARPRTRFVAEFLGRANFITSGGALHALRPERITLADQGAPGIITGWSYLGAAFDLAVECPGYGTLRLSVPAEGFTPQEGMAVHLAWDEAALVRVEAD